MSDPREASGCPRIGRLFRGCKFEARFDMMPPQPESIRTIKSSDPDCITAFFHGIARKTYVHDVCVRCGKIVKRSQL